jgi:gag-polypeptide of LTR copia-type
VLADYATDSASASAVPLVKFIVAASYHLPPKVIAPRFLCNPIMFYSEADTRHSSSSHRIPRFHGTRSDDYGLWRLRLRTACRAKLWSFVDPAVTRSGDTCNSQMDIDDNERACSIIIAALGDSALSVVSAVDEKPDQMLKLLDERYASSRAASRISVQTQLYRKSYTGGDMAKFIDAMGTLFSQLERMGNDAAIPESHKAPMLLASIPPDSPLEITAAALRTKDIAELTWEYVATTLIDEYEARSMRAQNGDIDGGSCGSRDRRSKKNIKQIHSKRANFDVADDIDAAAKAFGTAWRSNKTFPADKSKIVCEFCDKSGHSVEKCFFNPDNPTHQLPRKYFTAYWLRTNILKIRVLQSSHRKVAKSK